MAHTNCRGNTFFQGNRREFLTVGALGFLGLTLGDLLRLEAAKAQEGSASADPTFGKAKGLIHIFLPGGMAQQESFDPKPYAPLEYRGSFGTVKTNTGELFSENFPKLAQVADKFTVIRSMSHGEAAHERGTHNMFTGYRPSPAVTYPSLGSIVSHELGPRESLPPYVCIPNEPNPYAGPGYLSSAYGPFSLGADPAGRGFRVRDLSLPPGVDEQRFARRRTLLEAVNAHFASLEKADAIQAMDSFYYRAYEMLSSAKAREAFNLDAESPQIRERYGYTQAGQRFLLARRLIAAGVRVVTVTYGGWDFHEQIVPGTKRLAPALDQALAALFSDLDASGLLDETIVMVSTEFGRTPKVNGTAGRDHWPKVFSILLAGGGVTRGQIFGSSDATASEPASEPIGPEDLFATIYHLLGVDYEKRLIGPGNRPLNIVRDGRVRRGLIA
ncbi:hypothetical protein THTE_3017 [Thermogutta terrifontis]|jgi:hypothetical protein|uniref:Sulfatase n=1 Tax=Thermogutta terrifontis TaxID=1331910 RepID=A0A286RI33_9BACT|nr:DUF1501 domain-containing protein [Thermogutta terrifontis]ASV75619.1 hypothetical protein THTE_3017 [Thermogutta terrifontis]